MTLDQVLEALRLGENQDIEFKSAAGGLPRSLWATLSAFANTDGGTLVLGVAERGGEFSVEGVRKPEALLKAFWDGHNNPQKLNHPVCRETDVEVVALDRQTLLCIHVPRAPRQQQPVFVNGNPLLGAYKRNFEGDYRCTEAEVRQMLRDASDEAQDLQIFEGFCLDDLDAETLTAYRNRFASRDPDHPFLAQSTPEFLESLGALRRDRRSGAEGLTLAGLLIFGRERSLLDALPFYHLDYQEQLSDDPDERWTYRLTANGRPICSISITGSFPDWWTVWQYRSGSTTRERGDWKRHMCTKPCARRWSIHSFMRLTSHPGRLRSSSGGMPLFSTTLAACAFPRRFCTGAV